MMGAVVGTISLLSGFFTSDAAVIYLVNAVAPWLLIFFGVHGVLCSAEGILLGLKDLGFLGKVYAGFFAVVPFLLLQVKKAALTGESHFSMESVRRLSALPFP